MATSSTTAGDKSTPVSRNMSVLIRCHNEVGFVGRALQSCVDQLLQRVVASGDAVLQLVEVVCVDQGPSDDGSLDVIRRFQDSYGRQYKNRLSIKLVEYEAELGDGIRYTPGRALNLGVRHCTHELVLILSAHCELVGNCRVDKVFDLLMANGGGEQSLGKVAAVMGRQVPVCQGIRECCVHWPECSVMVGKNQEGIRRAYSDIFEHFLCPCQVATGGVGVDFDGEKVVVNMKAVNERNYGGYFFHNACCFYLRQTLIEMPFDEQCAGKEDRYWAKEVIDENNWVTLYFPRVTVLHHFTSNGATWGAKR